MICIFLFFLCECKSCEQLNTLKLLVTFGKVGLHVCVIIYDEVDIFMCSHTVTLFSLILVNNVLFMHSYPGVDPDFFKEEGLKDVAGG